MNELRVLFPDAAMLRRIGSGAYGSVWLAQMDSGVLRAIKYVPSAAGAEDRTDRELRAVRLLLSLKLPPDSGVIPVLDVRANANGFGYIMPLADSERPNWTADTEQYRPRTLRSDLVTQRALPMDICLDMAIRLASALECLQRHCLVHRDIKPSNVIYLEGAPVLADIGLLADTREAESWVGTPGYAPAEPQGRFSGDIYSLGVLLSELATGRPAEEHDYAPIDEADVASPLYAPFNALLRRLTDSNPARRPQTAGVVLRKLRELRQRTEGKRIAKRRRVLLSGCLAVVFAVLGLGAFWMHIRTVKTTPVPASPKPERTVEDNRPAEVERTAATAQPTQNNGDGPAWDLDVNSRIYTNASLAIKRIEEDVVAHVKNVLEQEVLRQVAALPAAAASLKPTFEELQMPSEIPVIVQMPYPAIRQGVRMHLYSDRIFLEINLEKFDISNWRLIGIYLHPGSADLPRVTECVKITTFLPDDGSSIPQEPPRQTIPPNIPPPSRKSNHLAVAYFPSALVPQNDLLAADWHPRFFFITTDEPDQWTLAIDDMLSQRDRNMETIRQRAQRENWSTEDTYNKLSTASTVSSLILARWNERYVHPGGRP